MQVVVQQGILLFQELHMVLQELADQILEEMVELLHHSSEHQETFTLAQVAVVVQEILLVAVNLVALALLASSLFVQLVVQMRMLQHLHPQVHGLPQQARRR
jgi:hypothetical protein